MSEFFVGQKVVCVNDAPNDFEFDPADWPLANGRIFTVCGIVWSDGTHGTPGLCLHLVEDTRGTCPCCGKIIPYRASRFRPLESKAISLFRKIARDVTEGRKVEFVE